MFLIRLSQLSKKKKQGVTIIEILIDLAVVGMVAVTLLTLLVANMKSATYAEMRVVAANLANDRMEAVRNLPYDNVGIGSPAVVPSFSAENIVFAGFSFRVITDYVYVDDPYDNTGSNDPDIAPYDYKKVTVRVYDPKRTNPVATVSSNIVSKAAETATNTGIIQVQVVDNPEKGSVPIADAVVHITNNSVSPAVDITAHTDNNGNLMVPLLPIASDNSYVVSVTKDGYSTDTTIAPGVCQTGVAPSPSANLNPNVNLQAVTQLTMQIRCLTDLQITVTDVGGTPQANTSIRVQSDRLICTDPKSKYDQWKTTDANGLITIPQIEHDRYFYTNN